MSNAKILIVLPVYNGADLSVDGPPKLTRQLDSILAQTYTDYTLLIIDNKSTDATADICRHYLEKDRRVEYHCQPWNLGFHPSLMMGVYRSFFHEYFIYASHNDQWEPEYLEECLRALEGNPQATVAYSRCILKSAESGRTEPYEDLFDLTAMDAPGRYYTIISQMGLCTAFYGLMRSSTLQINVYGFYQPSAAADNLMLARLAWKGPFIQIPRPLFIREMPKAMSHETWEERRRRLAEFECENRTPLWSAPFTDHIISHCQFLLNHTLVNSNREPETINKLIIATIQCMKARYGPLIEEEMKRTVDLLEKGIFFDDLRGTVTRSRHSNSVSESRPGTLAGILRLTAETQSRQRWLRMAVPGFHYGRALVFMMMGYRREALTALEEELQTNPTHRRSIELKIQLEKELG